MLTFLKEEKERRNESKRRGIFIPQLSFTILSFAFLANINLFRVSFLTLSRRAGRSEIPPELFTFHSLHTLIPRQTINIVKAPPFNKQKKQKSEEERSICSKYTTDNQQSMNAHIYQRRYISKTEEKSVPARRSKNIKSAASTC